MNAITKRHSGLLIAAALVLCAAAGGCRRADDSGSAGNPSGSTSGMNGPASAVGASGLTGPAVAPAPAPPQGASE